MKFSNLYQIFKVTKKVYTCLVYLYLNHANSLTNKVEGFEEQHPFYFIGRLRPSQVKVEEILLGSISWNLNAIFGILNSQDYLLYA